MPEGDTIARLARRLDDVVAGRVLRVGRLNTPAHATADLAGYRVLGTATHGKHLLTRTEALDGGPALTLHTHLRMDGSWVFTGPGRRLPRRMDEDVRVLLVTEEDRTAAAVSMPVVELLRTDEEHTAIGHLGPDVLHEGFDGLEVLRRMAADPSRPLVAVLLDQRVLAGLGNLWANELAYLTGVSPWTRVGDVDLVRLVDRAALALRHSATVEGAYQVTTGLGTRGETHWVSGRQRRPCLRCGTEVLIADEVPGDPGRRRTWWCPRCQPGPGPDR